MRKLFVGCIVMFMIASNVVVASSIIDVPFEMVNGLILIQADIDGEVDNFILDSGSNGVLLNAQASASEISYQSLDGEISGAEKRIEKLQIGTFVSEELLGFVTDLSDLEAYVGKSVGGILGCAVFTPKSLVFDFAAGRISISDELLDLSGMQGMRSLAFTMVDDLPLLEVSINGKPAQFILDTGASAHFIDDDMINSQSYQATGVAKSIITATGATNISLEYQTSGTAIDSEDGFTHFYQKDFEVLSQEIGIEIAGLVSLSSLSDDRVYFDLKRQKLYY